MFSNWILVHGPFSFRYTSNTKKPLPFTHLSALMRLLIRTLKYVLDILQIEEAFTVE